MSQLQSLSEEQVKAAFFYDAPVCILAGAGSGKTRVITHRIAYLVKEHHVPAYQIMGVTFTNKAAREMRERVEKLLPISGKDVILGTFHGLAAKFLRYYGNIIGIDKDFLIYDEDDATRLIKNIIKERYQVDKDELKLLTSKVLKLRGKDSIDDGDVKHEKAFKLTQIYQERLDKIGAVDFMGLLKKFLQLLKSEEGSRVIGQKVRHLVVDEYQDINDIQAQIVYCLAKNAQSVAVVGDDDQSIYGWRGASAKYMQQFLDTFEGAKLYRLVDNYRSTKPILDCANGVISHNKDRLGKELHAINAEGTPVRLNRHYRDTEEARQVVEKACGLFDQYGAQLNIAVLMRTNAQSRPLEEALHRARMPYRMVGGMKFYDRKEIKDILSTMRAVLNQNSDVDFLRTLNAVPLGIGKKTQETLTNYAGNNDLSFFQTISDEAHQLSALGNTRAKNKIDNLIELIGEMRSEMIRVLPDGEVLIMRADEALIYVIDKFGFLKRLEEKDHEDKEARIENIEQLVQSAVAFVEEADRYQNPNDAQSFLENVALVSKDESVAEEAGSKKGLVTLMTLHAAKGLEFDCVFLVGLEEGVLPHARSLGELDDKRQNALEEERRLMYVGITRAKSMLYLSYCQDRFMHGKSVSTLPSRFLKELPSHTIHESDSWLLSQVNNKLSIDNRIKRAHEKPYEKPKLPLNDYQVEYDLDTLDNVDYAPGKRCYHNTYQEGNVLSVTKVGRMLRVKVRFDDDGQVRTIMASHLKPL